MAKQDDLATTHALGDGAVRSEAYLSKEERSTTLHYYHVSELLSRLIQIFRPIPLLGQAYTARASHTRAYGELVMTALATTNNIR